MKNADKKYRIIWHDELDSTNAEVLRHVSELDNLSVVAAVCQTAGRGQKGNKWLSAPGDNLTFTILLRPSCLPLKDFMCVTFLATLAVRDYLIAQSIPAVIKWPNDIYVGKKKICGMLIESVTEAGLLKEAVIGIGLNMNQTDFPAELLNPTSAKKVSGRTFELKQALEDIMDFFAASCHLLDSAEGRLQLRHLYEKDLFQKGESCAYRDYRTGELIEGTILGIVEDGRLNLDGRLYDFKEIGYIL